MDKLPTVTAEYVRQLINYSPHEPDGEQSGFAKSQLEGTVSLFNMLATNRIAYLADEVGMGKTYIALGVMGLLRHFNPTARVVVISPRENIQHKWIKERSNFVRNNWLVRGHRVKSIQGGPAWDAVACGSLMDFVHESALEANRDFFLRMSSFSLAAKQEDNRKRYLKRLKDRLPWLAARRKLSYKRQEDFIMDLGASINEVIANADLLIFDEAHNLKHGAHSRASIRNRLMSFTFGHPEGVADNYENHTQRATRVLFLSATPFEDDFAAIHRQFSVFGYDAHPLKNHLNRKVGTLAELSSDKVSGEKKTEIVSSLMIRRVAALNIAGKRYTKNMYRREWRDGGLEQHDKPISVEDPKAQLIIALMQKKVSEVLQHERFNNSFQMGMLSSFESFRQSVSRKSMGGDVVEVGAEDSIETNDTITMSEEQRLLQRQGNLDEKVRQGVDTEAIERVVTSYKERFGEPLPHPKLDITAKNLGDAFLTGEKTLVFVRRVATVHELASKVDRLFDQWVEARFREALPDLEPQLNSLFLQYQSDSELMQAGPIVLKGKDVALADVVDPDTLDITDEAGGETFFSWFFRGDGISTFQSGSNFRKSRFSRNASMANFFADNQLALILGFPSDIISALCQQLACTKEELTDQVNTLANRILQWQLSVKDSKAEYGARLDRTQRFEAAQLAGLELLSRSGSNFASDARFIADIEYEHLREGLNFEIDNVERFSVEEYVSEQSLYCVMGCHFPQLLEALLPAHACLIDRPSSLSFDVWYIERERRRELLSTTMNLGMAYVDLYLCAVSNAESIKLGEADKGGITSVELAERYCRKLVEQKASPAFSAWHELSALAESYRFVIDTNFPEVYDKTLGELPRYYALTLRNQSPVGRMEGGVSKQLVKQFRQPGFPLVLIATDVLQEGEDLHTFCKNIIHYGIAWTPSAIEQRIGRVDRIGGLLQRSVDAKDFEPSPEQYLQVYYPHLQGTVEVLQVRRVLRKLYRFISLVHSNVENVGETDSTINIGQEISQAHRELPRLDHELESAFPGTDWLAGKYNKKLKPNDGVDAIVHYFESLVIKLAKHHGIQWSPVQRDYHYSGDFSVEGNKHRFTLELRSQVRGDNVLLRCECPVADIGSAASYQRLLKYQQRAGLVKLCLVPLAGGRSEVRVREGIIFHPKYTQWNEVEGVVLRTIEHAANARAAWEIDSAS